MLRRLATLVGGLLLALGAVGIIFVAGMRAKSPLVLDPVRRAGRATKRFVLPSSGTPGGIASVISHVGRSTGRPYDTPVQAVVTEEGFVIALPYGLNTDWLKNVLVSRSATIVHEGNTYGVDQPEIVPTALAARHFSPKDQRTHRLFRVDQCLVLRRVEANDAGQCVADPS